MAEGQNQTVETGWNATAEKGEQDNKFKRSVK